MKIINHLDAINTEFEGVQIIAFVDISARVVLGNVAKGSIKQEFLDRLCVQADILFNGPIFSIINSLSDNPNEAFIIGQSDVLACVRSVNTPTDALLCVCDHTVDLAKFLPRAHTVLAQMGGA